MEESVRGPRRLRFRDPRLYTPNQQSGTDPSVHDVLGRRIYGTVQLTF